MSQPSEYENMMVEKYLKECIIGKLDSAPSVTQAEILYRFSPSDLLSHLSHRPLLEGDRG
jgi:hypothetical protein